MKYLIQYLRMKLANYRITRTVKEIFPSVHIEKNVIIKGDIKNLKLGRNIIIQSGTVLHLGGMEWCQNKGYLEIGDYSVISPNCVLYGSGTGGIFIGKHFDCGPGVGIFASRTDYLKGTQYHIFAPVRIGNRVIVYANVVISPGVVIGNKATIAACSVVTKDVPDNALVGGCPSSVIRMIPGD